MMGDGDIDIVWIMTAILTTVAGIVISLISIQTPVKSTNHKTKPTSSFFPCPKTEPSKYAYEQFCTKYTPIWILSFCIIVLFQLYESFTATTYNVVCLSLALPFLLQPIFIPSAFHSSPDQNRPLFQRYAFKANIWIAIYSFIGNYWYTHYFYSVLKASYSMPSTRLNNVPIAMFFATHFYFSSYHIFSNVCLRKIQTTYQAGFKRMVLYVVTVFSLSYFTAFMETLTISSFPYYSFEDRNMAYTVGSAFYSIYFLVSFPAFVEFDNHIDLPDGDANKKEVTLWDTVVQSCGYGMIILCLLDFVRLYLDIPLVVGADP